MMTREKLVPLGIIFLALGLGGNGLWMLADSAGWYAAIPGLTHTGPFNDHFVRDIGLAYVTTAVILAMALRWRQERRLLTGIASLWLIAHAGMHLYDIAVGTLPAEHLQLDAGGVFFPALLALALTWYARGNTSQS